MAIHTHYLNVIIPVSKIDTSKFVGGLLNHLSENDGLTGKNIYCDEYLYRDGAMGPPDIEQIVKFWEDQGLVLHEEIDGKKHWKDLCVVDMMDGPTLPCDWIEFDRVWDDKDGYFSYVYLKGKPKGLLVSAIETMSGKEL